MIPIKIIKGYNCLNLYRYLFDQVMFSARYKYVNHKLLRRYIARKYCKTLGFIGKD